jgi:ribosomal protein L22
LTVDEGRNAEAVGREVRISSDESRLAAFAIRAGKAASVSCKTVQNGLFFN